MYFENDRSGSTHTPLFSRYEADFNNALQGNPDLDNATDEKIISGKRKKRTFRKE